MRQIQILLIGFLLTCTGLSGRADVCVDDRACVVGELQSCLGVREKTGKNDGPEVESFLASVGLGKGYAWCGAFLNKCFQTCSADTPKSAAWSPAWFPDSKIIFRHADLYSGKVYKNPQPGDVIGLYYPRLKRVGHVGAVIEWGAKTVRTIEGNTSGGGSREGDGVYYMVRPVQTIHAVADWIST